MDSACDNNKPARVQRGEDTPVSSLASTDSEEVMTETSEGDENLIRRTRLLRQMLAPPRRHEYGPGSSRTQSGAIHIGGVRRSRSDPSAPRTRRSYQRHESFDGLEPWRSRGHVSKSHGQHDPFSRSSEDESPVFAPPFGTYFPVPSGKGQQLEECQRTKTEIEKYKAQDVLSYFQRDIDNQLHRLDKPYYNERHRSRRNCIDSPSHVVKYPFPSSTPIDSWKHRVACRDATYRLKHARLSAELDSRVGKVHFSDILEVKSLPTESVIGRASQTVLWCLCCCRRNKAKTAKIQKTPSSVPLKNGSTSSILAKKRNPNYTSSVEST